MPDFTWPQTVRLTSSSSQINIGTESYTQIQSHAELIGKQSSKSPVGFCLNLTCSSSKLGPSAFKLARRVTLFVGWSTHTKSQDNCLYCKHALFWTQKYLFLGPRRETLVQQEALDALKKQYDDCTGVRYGGVELPEMVDNL